MCVVRWTWWDLFGCLFLVSLLVAVSGQYVAVWWWWF